MSLSNRHSVNIRLRSDIFEMIVINEQNTNEFQQALSEYQHVLRDLQRIKTIIAFQSVLLEILKYSILVVTE